MSHTGFDLDALLALVFAFAAIVLLFFAASAARANSWPRVVLFSVLAVAAGVVAWFFGTFQIRLF